ncbi:MAG: AAA family ATPase [Parasphingopyxis sp.]|uniref:TrlF family AAA-like ATPase n=1 Tax=Parasphingopyxis sp. TaxID=1920299 RepID=UPI0032ECF9AF
MLSRGSQWHRWDPHIHAPGTLLNNQFGSDWDAYLSALESRNPIIEAIAITDYYVTETYEEVLKHKAAGRLPNVKLLFPNIELRLDVAAKSGFVNAHLLVSPEDPDHVAEIKRILKRLDFHAYEQRFDCSREELMRLGRQANPSLVDDRAALEFGATQMKVSFETLRKVFKENDWAKQNVLIAVAGGTGDGTGGVRQAADATIRHEIEKFAHVIFASSTAQREFWLGQRTDSVEQLRERYGGCKPCMHGSDAHEIAKVGVPEDDRFCWIKGALSFDALRQACIDPDGRAYVGIEPPKSAMPSQVISEITVHDTGWAATPIVPLNPGLVAVIGARGSGKTALADMVAAGCDAIPSAAWKTDENVSPSFLVRARSLIGTASVTLSWAGGSANTSRLDGSNADNPLSFPRARYLSQQFVEELCSAKGASEGLIREIERVIFEAHPIDDRDGALNFEELRQNKLMQHQQARRLGAEAISAISERIGEELEKENSVAGLKLQVSQKRTLVESYISDRSKLVVTGTEAQVKRHAELSDVARLRQSEVNAFVNRKRTFGAMQAEVANLRSSKAPEMLREAQARHAAGLSPEQWENFLLDYKGPVDADLASYVAWADQKIAELKGIPPVPGDPNVTLIPDGTDLSKVTLSVLNAEIARLTALFSADKLVRDQYTALSNRITQEQSALQNLESRLTDAKGATARRKQLQTERTDSYRSVIEALIAEQHAMEGLYKPLMQRLSKTSGTLSKLSFSVARKADVITWGNTAEDDLIDCRRSGPFYGRGKLIEAAENTLKDAWETGSAIDVQAAMDLFQSDYWDSILIHALARKEQPEEFRKWLKSFAHWLFATDHISVGYEMRYDGTDIRMLSPGTRGIVLLLLYLALDDADDRPLIIDQPEENLDPKSVFEELVSLFIEAKTRRQVIIVTHNANLVVNTDADQIIVAEAGSHRAGGIPDITYTAGGLEDESIRKAVCDILEGGEDAFKERARRMRVRLAR